MDVEMSQPIYPNGLDFHVDTVTINKNSLDIRTSTTNRQFEQLSLRTGSEIEWKSLREDFEGSAQSIANH